MKKAADNTPDSEEKIWFSEIMACLRQNKAHDTEQILVNHHPQLSMQSYNDLASDHKIFNNGTLTLYGIYRFEPENEIIVWTHKILQFLKNDLLTNKNIKRTFTLAEITDELKIPPLQLQVCFRLINGIPMRNYFNLSGKYVENNFEAVTVSYANADVLRYESLKVLFAEIFSSKKTTEENGDDILSIETEIAAEEAEAAAEEEPQLPRIITSFPMTDAKVIQDLKNRYKGKRITEPLLRELEKITKDGQWTDEEKGEIFGKTRDWYGIKRREYFKEENGISTKNIH